MTLSDEQQNCLAAVLLLIALPIAEWRSQETIGAFVGYIMVFSAWIASLDETDLGLPIPQNAALAVTVIAGLLLLAGGTAFVWEIWAKALIGIAACYISTILWRA